jgi:hypothetical protein
MTGTVGSNPTLSEEAGLAVVKTRAHSSARIEHWIADPRVGGSNPLGHAGVDEKKPCQPIASTSMKIDSYSFGYMSIGGKGYSTDLIILPRGEVRNNWWRKQGHRLLPDDLERIEGAEPDIIVVGTGANGMMKVPNETLKYLKNICEEYIIEDTAQAVRSFNRLQESRRVVGLFHLTC